MKNENERNEKFCTYIFLGGGKNSPPPNVKIKTKPQQSSGKVMRERIIRFPLIYYFQLHY